MRTCIANGLRDLWFSLSLILALDSEISPQWQIVPNPIMTHSASAKAHIHFVYLLLWNLKFLVFTFKKKSPPEKFSESDLRLISVIHLSLWKEIRVERKVTPVWGPLLTAAWLAASRTEKHLLSFGDSAVGGYFIQQSWWKIFFMLDTSVPLGTLGVIFPTCVEFQDDLFQAGIHSL